VRRKGTPGVSEIILKIDNVDYAYAHGITDEMNRYQPFLLSMLLGYRLDLKPGELEEIIKIVFMIWEYFRANQNVRNTKLTEQGFERIQKRNIELIKYLEGESQPSDIRNITSSDLDHLKSKALLTGIFFRFNTKNALLKMDTTTKGTLLIGMKSVIECFEEIGNK